MKCPICQAESKVIDSRKANRGLKRRRECGECFTRFTTFEHIVINSMDKHLLDKYYARVGG